MAISAEPASRHYTYPDLATFPDDHFRREIIDGELIVTPSPITRHQSSAGNLYFRLRIYANESGGKVFFAPYDVYFALDNVVQPDVLFIRADRLEIIGKKFLGGPPDVVVEISSPSTRHLELVRKRELYQRFGVAEYWYVDLEAERVEVYTLSEGAYPAPRLLYPGEMVRSNRLSGFAMPVAEALGEEPSA